MDYVGADEQQILIDRYITAYNGFDVDGMLAVLHPDVESRNVSGGEVNASASGAEEFRRMVEQSKGFSSRRQQIIRFRWLQSPRDCCSRKWPCRSVLAGVSGPHARQNTPCVPPRSTSWQP